jgi:RimJ/RimL family protein N-acetyltransferase
MVHPTLIRKAAESDAGALHALRLALFEESDTLLWEPGEYRATVADEARQIAQLSANSLCLVAERDRQLVAFLYAMGGQVNRTRHSTRLALGVLRSSWGRGVATRLVQEALAWSRSIHLARVELTVHTTNLRALSIYLRAGFQVEGVRRKSLLVGGRYVDEYQMSVINAV